MSPPDRDLPPPAAAGQLRLTVSGPAELTLERDQPGDAHTGAVRVTPLPLTADDAAAGIVRYEAVVEGWRFEVAVEPARRAALRERAQLAAATSQASASARLRAQIPGRVTRVWIAEGEQVEQGQRLLAIEAMKMENEIRAPRAGQVTALTVTEGRLVELNDDLLTIG